ncbi:MAG: hypothetical protein EXR05_09360 [Acetobacteraceae bacterium]|nr:hypothetical protein [Acetobacteraceae bacterium]
MLTGFRAGLLAAALCVPGVTLAQTFDQGRVETRAARNPSVATADADPLESESLFGFTLGSDIDHEGAIGVAVETIIGSGRRDGRYTGANTKLELSWAAAKNLSVSGSLLGGYWNIKNNPALPDTNAMRFRGLGGEVRWRWLDRSQQGVGLTLHLEPSIAIADELTGEAGFGFASENKLIMDAELVRDRLWGAVNLVWDMERFRPWADGSVAEEGSVGGITGALTARVTEGFFLGGEIRYLTAFDGLTFGKQVGHALYVGPTAYWRISESAWLSLAWNTQVAGHENNDPRSLDLTNFSQNVFRIKMGWEF